MGLFKKKDKVIDLTGYYEKNKERIDSQKQKDSKPDYEEIGIKSRDAQTSNQAGSSSSSGFFGGFFGGGPSSASPSPQTSTSEIQDSVNPEERRRKLAKRLQDMTSKIEDLSNQIYHLQQRLELVERKLDISKF